MEYRTNDDATREQVFNAIADDFDKSGIKCFISPRYDIRNLLEDVDKELILEAVRKEREYSGSAKWYDAELYWEDGRVKVSVLGLYYVNPYAEWDDPQGRGYWNNGHLTGDEHKNAEWRCFYRASAAYLGKTLLNI